MSDARVERDFWGQDMIKQKNRGGRPSLHEGEAAQLLNVSMSVEDKEYFMSQMVKHGVKSKSGMFRLMLKFWRERDNEGIREGGGL